MLPPDELLGYSRSGELALDGSLTGVTGVLLAAIAAAARGSGSICPAACGGEAAWAGEVEILAAPTLLALVNHFKGIQVLSPPEPLLAPTRAAEAGPARTSRARRRAKRALEIAAAGGHNLLMVGPPGSGKSMLAARLPGILPPLDPAEALEVSMIHSVAGALRGRRTDARSGRSATRIIPPRCRRWSAAACAPGRARSSLAHLGVLFLDELPEFNRADAGGAAPAARERPGHGRPRQRPCDLPGPRSSSSPR